jgi:hypothetical protein
MAEVVRLSQKSQAVLVRIPVMIDQAYLLAPGDNRDGAEVTAQDALTRGSQPGSFSIATGGLSRLGRDSDAKAKP